MAKYTTEVRTICENLAGQAVHVSYAGIDEIIEVARPQIFDFSYPIFDEEYRAVLEAKILRYYWTREIGLETYGLWKLHLRNTLDQIMPLYNQLYKSQQLHFNPLFDVDLTVERDTQRDDVTDTNSTRNRMYDSEMKSDDNERGTANQTGSENTGRSGTSNSTGEYGGTEWNLHSDTPQGSVAHVQLDNNLFLSDAQKKTNEDRSRINNTDSSNENTNTTNNETKNNARDYNEERKTTEQNTGIAKETLVSTEDYIERVTGKRGGVSYSKLIMEYRDTFLNIDRMILNDLSDLFMLLW